LLNRTPEWQAWVYDNSLAAGVFRRRGNYNPRKAGRTRTRGWGHRGCDDPIRTLSLLKNLFAGKRFAIQE